MEIDYEKYALKVMDCIGISKPLFSGWYDENNCWILQDTVVLELVLHWRDGRFFESSIQVSGAGDLK